MKHSVRDKQASLGRAEVAERTCYDAAFGCTHIAVSSWRCGTSGRTGRRSEVHAWPEVHSRTLDLDATRQRKLFWDVCQNSFWSPSTSCVAFPVFSERVICPAVCDFVFVGRGFELHGLLGQGRKLPLRPGIHVLVWPSCCSTLSRCVCVCAHRSTFKSVKL
eukprot:5531452-Amphidinium_carterae.1